MVKFLRIKKIFNKPKGNEILVITFHRLGDSVFTIPALKEIRKFYKKDFYIFCFEETRPVFELFFKKEFIIAFKHTDFILNNRIAKKVIRKKIKEINPGKIFDLTGTITSATVLFNANADEITGVNEKYFKPLFTNYVPVRKKPHIIDIYLDAIKPIIPIEDSDKLKEFPVEIKKDGYILIHPFAGFASKEWNFNKFIQLAEKLSSDFNVRIVSQVNKINDEVKNEFISKGIEISETKDIYELINIIKGCSLMVSNDSGPLYIANLVCKPTFTIYGPTNPDFHLPFGSNHRFVQKKINCSPQPGEKYCYTNAGRDGCPSYECMNQLQVDEVYNKLKPFLIELEIHRKGKPQTTIT